MTDFVPKIGILAGGGRAPFELIRACCDQGRPFFVIGIKGQVDEDLPVDKALDFGAFGAFKKICERENITELVMLGRVHRPSITEIRPDFLGLKVLAKIGLNARGDDSVLRAVAQAIESECGVRVVGAHEVVEDLLMSEGVLTKVKPSEQVYKDIVRGLEVARGLGALDVGQAVVVQQGVVLGVEAVEGTDALIQRASELKRRGGGGVLVKCSKPQQDPRFDLPTLGPDTIRALAAAGFAGVAMEAGKGLFIDRAATIRLADEEELFVVGMNA
ncbi:MAG: LpxI family protein [Bdellovibrionales bacterium]